MLAKKGIRHPQARKVSSLIPTAVPKNVALAAEICDGWLPMFFSPKADTFYRAALAEGFARPGARQTAGSFEVAAVAK